MKNKLAKKFFAYVAKHFPVMCASGAFSLMPPVAEAAKWLDRLDDLSRDGIIRHVAILNGFKNDFLAAEARAATPQEKAEARALALSAGGAVAELDSFRTWEHEPDFYLLVAFTGLEQAVDLPAKSEAVRQKRFIKRLRAIPGLLAHAPNNIETTSIGHRGASQTMIRDCARYLTELAGQPLGKGGKASKFLSEALEALKNYDRFVSAITEVPDQEGLPFDQLLENVLGTSKTPQAIYDMACEEFEHRLQSLQWLASRIGGNDWKALYQQYPGPPTDGLESVDLIVREIHRLRIFVQEGPLANVFAESALRIDPQPRHLASILRPIHHDPALGAWENEPSRCYVSPQLFSTNRFKDDTGRIASRRKGFPLLAATETYPGRHLLASQRLTLDDTPLSQVTNPLFTAGWLAFAENLLDELGYLETPQDRLVHHVRGLHKAALARIDAGLAIGTLDQEGSLAVLNEAGFTREEGLSHIRAALLAPSRKALPILGLHEISTLRKEWNVDLSTFCKGLFAGGQLPFSMIKKP